MDPDGVRPGSARQTVVTVALTSVAAAFSLLLLVMIGGGFFVYLVGIVGAIVAFGGFHYLVWGRLLTQETAGEREEEQLRQRALAEDADEPDERIRR
jgi:arginine exporter protein ArgO